MFTDIGPLLMPNVCGLIFSSQVQEHTKNYDRSGSVHLSLVLHVNIRNIVRVLVITFKMIMNKIIFLNVYEVFYFPSCLHLFPFEASRAVFRRCVGLDTKA